MSPEAGSRPMATPRLCRNLRVWLATALTGIVGTLAAQDAVGPRDTAPSVVAPATPRAAEPLPQPQRVASLAMYFAVLVGLAGIGIYLLRNGLPLRGLRSGEARKLQIVEMRALGNRQFLLVVEYEQNRMLLGVTSGRIDYLCPLDGGGGSRFEAPPAPEPVGAS